MFWAQTALLLCMLMPNCLGDYPSPPEPKHNYVIAGDEIIDLARVDDDFFDGVAALDDPEARRGGMVEDREETFYSSDWEELAEGVTVFKGTSSMSFLTLFGPQAFPIATNQKGDATYAGSRLGDGRIIAVGRYDYIAQEKVPENEQFARNVVKWLSNGREDPGLACRDWEKILGHPDTIDRTPISVLANGTIDVYMINARTDIPEEEQQVLLDWVTAGGGLIVAQEAWYWETGKPGRTFMDFPGNKILMKAGLMIGDYNWGRRDYSTSLGPPPKETNLFYALGTLGQNPDDQVALSALRRTGKMVFQPDYATVEVFQDLLNQGTSIYRDSIGKPIPFSVLTKALVGTLVASPTLRTEIPKATDVETFPYEVTSPERVDTFTFQINGTSPGLHRNEFYFSGAGAWEWQSTGAYAAAGEFVKYTIPEDMVGEFEFQVGCHTDVLYSNEELLRSPEITTRFKVVSTTGYITNPWGGPIYVAIPKASTLGVFDLTLENFAKMPSFVYGRDDNNNWLDEIINHPAPWGEIIVPGQLIYTFPAREIKLMTDPESYAEYWLGEMIAANKLAGFDNGLRNRTERLVFDIQITHGYMHSGYPMMSFIEHVLHPTNASILPNFLDTEYNQREGSFIWGHEIGHNHQWKYWTIEPTIQLMCNFWSIINRNRTTKWANKTTAQMREGRENRIFEYVFKGKDFSEWQHGVVEDTYVILADQFGWESYTKTFQFYYANDTKPKERESDSQRLNGWVQAYSTVVNVNLCPYFEWWSWPITDYTREICNLLPDWDKQPMEKYNHDIADRGDCPEGWTAFAENCYFFSDEERSWFDAESYCAQQPDTHLASCLTEAEFGFIANRDETYFWHWIGYSDLHDHTTWKSLDGSAAAESFPWLDGYPNPEDRDHCSMYRRGRVFDYDCFKKDKFVCKMGPGACAPNGNCPADFFHFGSKCYHWSPSQMTYDEATSYCEDKSSALVEIDDQAESDYLTQTAYSIRYSGFLDNYWASYWIGLVDHDGTFSEWNSGNPVIFDNWCEGEPNGNQGRILLWGNRNFCWDDNTVASSKKNAVCERPVVL